MSELIDRMDSIGITLDAGSSLLDIYRGTRNDVQELEEDNAALRQRVLAVLEPFAVREKDMDDCGDPMPVQLNARFWGPVNGLHVRDFRRAAELYAELKQEEGK